MKVSTVKKILCVGFMATLLMSTLSAAPKKKAKKGSAKSKYDSIAKQKDSKGKVWDFGGIDIKLYNWWSGPDQEGGDPISPADADNREWHKWNKETYNFQLKEMQYNATWDSYPAALANFCIVGDTNENAIFAIDARSVIPGMRSDLFYDLSKITIVDWNASKWDRSTREIMSKGSKFYSMRYIVPEPRGGVFFNKRLLEECGIDPELPYDLQKAGKWNWEEFEKLLAACTKDLDNDGIMDIYGMANSSSEFMPLAAISNGMPMVGRDANGKYVNNMGTDNVLEAAAWAAHLAQNYEMPQPEGSEWNWMYPAFINGQVVFQVDQQYHCNLNGDYSPMTDDFGFVAFPYGPKSDGKYRTLHNDNFYILPSYYDDATAEKIVKAFDLWTEPTPGYDDEEAWKERFYTCFRDARAVDETLVYMTENPSPRYDTLIPDINYMGDFIWVTYPGYVTPQQAYEDTKNFYDGLLKDANR